MSPCCPHCKNTLFLTMGGSVSARNDILVVYCSECGATVGAILDNQSTLTKLINTVKAIAAHLKIPVNL